MLREKFFQNPGLMATLLNTGNKKLVESSYNDLWGTGMPISNPNALDKTKWTSTGLLGKILMSIRTEKQDIISGNRDMETSDSMAFTSVETD